jgi:hypothetical protein
VGDKNYVTINQDETLDIQSFWNGNPVENLANCAQCSLMGGPDGNQAIGFQTVTIGMVDTTSASVNSFMSNSFAIPFDPTDKSYQLSVALKKTGMYALTQPKTYACGAAAEGTIAATVAAPVLVGAVATMATATQKVVDAANSWLGLQKGDTFYQEGPKDFTQAIGHACLGGTAP